MGHELFDNMRNGDWYLEYANKRLQFFDEELKPVIHILGRVISMIK